MANKTVGNGVGPVHSRNNVNHQNQFVLQAVLLRTGKVNIPPASPQPVPTGKPKVLAPVPTSRQNRPFPVPTDRGYSLSITSGWWENGQLLLSPQQVVLGKHIEKENPYSDAEDEGIFDSGCSRSMTGNMERLDDFQEFQGGKVTFGGGEGKEHKASYKAITAVSSISEPFQLLHMDLFGPILIQSIDHKYYCLVIIDDYSRKPVKQKGIIVMPELHRKMGLLREKNRTLIEAARTMLADYKLPTMFWTEAVRTACYVLNRVLGVQCMHNKRVEETMNLRYLEEKPNVQGLGHEWYFDLDYLTDTLGYKRVQANQSAGTQEASTNPAGTQDASWDIILARLQANPDLSSTIFGVDFTDDDFATRMVALVNSRRKELAEQRAQEWRDRPMTPAQLRQYMRTYVKNQGPAVYTTGWTMAQVRKLSPEQLQEEFDKIQR
ncbi:putative ribonuclease H-like domain-containing protein, partial [Tanacetum coccineum]